MERGGAFRILIVGDFSGGGQASVPVAERRIQQVDRDDFEELFHRLAVTTALDVVEGSVERVQFPEFDALHPDWLFDRLAGFERLRSLRRRLNDPATFQAALTELGAVQASEPSRPAARDTEAGTAGLEGAALLAAALEATDAEASAAGAGTGSEIVDAVLRELVIPNVTPGADPRLPEFVAAVDEAIAELMRRVLVGLRPLEARWLGLRLLVRRVETSAQFSLHLLDATTDEVAQALATEDDPADTALWKRLVDRGVGVPGGEPWSVVALADPVEQGPSIAALLGRLGALSRAAGGVLLCGAGSSWFAAAGAGEHVAISGAGDPASVGLVAPRMLLRMPYGVRGGAVERFRFEEVGPLADPDQFCWGSGVFAALIALAAGFAVQGWAMDPRAVFELEGLPAWVHDLDGETELLPCAERWLTDREADELRGRGFAVLRSVRGRDAIRVGPLVALDGAPLSWPAGDC